MRHNNGANYGNRVHTTSITFGRRPYWRFGCFTDGDPWSYCGNQRHPIAHATPHRQRSIAPTGSDLFDRSVARRTHLDRNQRTSSAAKRFKQPAAFGPRRRSSRFWIRLGQWLHEWPRGMRHFPPLRSLYCCDINLHEHRFYCRPAASSRFWRLKP